MSAKVKQRNTANPLGTLTISLNEKILKECYDLYTDPEDGLAIIGESMGLKLLPPRKKITIMVMGNHSAGKSSFINWYIEEHILKTGVAIETQGFSLVTSGKKRESLTGNATLHLYPHFESVREIDGVVDYLKTEISFSKQKNFPLVTFVDTPGLVDGDMKYPFDVNEAILWLGNLCDLILVFFDPMGQALCKRTLAIVEELNERYPERIRFFLSKADEAGSETDRQRVMMQIVQEICKRPGLNKTGFDMPTIYIPNMSKMKSLGFSLFGFLVPIAVLFQLLVASAPREELIKFFGPDMGASLSAIMSPTTAFWQRIGDDNQLTVLVLVLTVSGLLLLLSRLFSNRKPTLQKKSKAVLLRKKELVTSKVKPRKQKLYNDYLHQCISEEDI